MSSIDARVEMLEALVKSMQKQIDLLLVKDKKNEVKVKRALTGYQLFCKFNRAEAIESLTWKKLGSLWQEQSDEEKEAWKMKANALKSSDSEVKVKEPEVNEEIKQVDLNMVTYMDMLPIELQDKIHNMNKTYYANVIISACKKRNADKKQMLVMIREIEDRYYEYDDRDPTEEEERQYVMYMDAAIGYLGANPRFIEYVSPRLLDGLGWPIDCYCM